MVKVRLFGDASAQKPTSEHETMHDALTSVRQPRPGTRLVWRESVVATSVHGTWELRDAGVSLLSEEYYRPHSRLDRPEKGGTLARLAKARPRKAT